MTEPTMVRAKGDGVEIQLAVWKGSGKPVIGIHGLTANSRCWDAVVPAVAPSHQLLAVDLRGRGLSDKPPTGYSEEQHIKDLECVMDDLQLKNAVLMGHSLGSYISMGFAARYPERVAGLILIDGGGELPTAHWERVMAAIQPAIDRLERSFPSVDVFLDLMKQAPFLQPWSDQIETYFRYDMVESDDGVRSRIQPAHIREELSNKRATGAAQYYSKLKCPVLILRATEGILSPDDILLPESAMKQMMSAIPNARRVDLVSTNHYSIVFQPNVVRDKEISTFLDSLGRLPWKSQENLKYRNIQA